MADKKIDSNDLFGQMLTQWETMTNQIANNVMGTSQFSQGQNTAIKTSLKIRETMHEQMTRFLEVANMPSRADITELRSAVAKIDARLDRIERNLVGMPSSAAAAGAPAVKGPPRTRQPSSSSKNAAKDG